ncbi:MAG: hypothetical protein WEC75_09930 [Dehalococcoidia bacterium]
MADFLDREPLATDEARPVRCPVCGTPNLPMQYCRHVRWTFDQGDPVDFARFAVETSPYVRNRGARPSDIIDLWWNENADWVIEQALLRFHAEDGYVFGELSDLDNLTRDIWQAFRPDPVRPSIIPR